MPLTPEQRDFAGEHHNLIYSFLKRQRLGFDEWYGIAAFGFCVAAVRFDPARKKAFSSFAYTVMLNEVRKEMRKNRKIPLTVSLQDELGAGFRIEDTVGYEQDFTGPGTDRLLREFMSALGRPLHRRIFAMSLEGWMQREIAEETGYSQSQISRILCGIRRDFGTYYKQHQ